MADVRFNPWRVDGSDHSASILFGFRRARRVVVIGVGWDKDHPLRPWPWLTTTPTSRGVRGFCLSCCGLFLQWRRLSGGRPSPAHLAAAAERLDEPRYRDQLQRLRDEVPRG